ncbi:hypothetical protein O9G_004759 [Rozella allomycis CSF55]|uniref:DUF4219 domain-containing protein n=1 Tax=Rozella allomycis (strain CSF55) TaxID=988480 RepID=A0A075ARQ2_ROZAC|nr:hypothetical protein O9G_004759 [Rozella allomycis CSF55]|eukprot:EPZ31198.1 hypothetical protein O9G_004759 [Rozella allomycis CSF55]
MTTTELSSTTSGHADLPAPRTHVTTLTIGCPLKGQENFEEWACQMKVLLKAHQLWDNKQDSPKTENTHAHHAIVNNLDKTLIHLVLDTVDASDAWERLKSQYKSESVPRKLKFIQELIAHDFAIGTLEDGFNRVATLERNLTASNGSDSIKITDLTFLIGVSAIVIMKIRKLVQTFRRPTQNQLPCLPSNGWPILDVLTTW